MSDELIDGGDELQSGFRPSRRKVLVAAAWTVPVVIVGSAAPALADSSAPVSVSSWGPFCKHTQAPNKGTYHLGMTWVCAYTGETEVRIDSITVNGTVFTTGFQPRELEFNGVSPAGGVAKVIHLTTGNNANAVITDIKYTVMNDAFPDKQYTTGTGGEKNLPPCHNENPPITT